MSKVLRNAFIFKPESEIAFSDQLQYYKNEGFRTASKSLLFFLLGKNGIKSYETAATKLIL